MDSKERGHKPRKSRGKFEFSASNPVEQAFLKKMRNKFATDGRAIYDREFEFGRKLTDGERKRTRAISKQKNNTRLLDFVDSILGVDNLAPIAGIDPGPDIYHARTPIIITSSSVPDFARRMLPRWRDAEEPTKAFFAGTCLAQKAREIGARVVYWSADFNEAMLTKAKGCADGLRYLSARIRSTLNPAMLVPGFSMFDFERHKAGMLHVHGAVVATSAQAVEDVLTRAGFHSPDAQYQFDGANGALYMAKDAILGIDGRLALRIDDQLREAAKELYEAVRQRVVLVNHRHPRLLAKFVKNHWDFWPEDCKTHSAWVRHLKSLPQAFHDWLERGKYRDVQNLPPAHENDLDVVTSGEFRSETDVNLLGELEPIECLEGASSLDSGISESSESAPPILGHCYTPIPPHITPSTGSINLPETSRKPARRSREGLAAGSGGGSSRLAAGCRPSLSHSPARCRSARRSRAWCSGVPPPGYRQIRFRLRMGEGNAELYIVQERISKTAGAAYKPHKAMKGS